MEELLKAYQEMIRVHGWLATAATIGMKQPSLEARVYELNGHQGMLVSTAMTIQRYSGTTLFAQAVAQASGGVFVPLPAEGEPDVEELQEQWHALYQELGDLSKAYAAAIKDGEISKKERRQLEKISNDMHRTMKQLMSMMFLIYCRDPGRDGSLA